MNETPIDEAEHDALLREGIADELSALRPDLERGGRERLTRGAYRGAAFVPRTLIASRDHEKGCVNGDVESIHFWKGASFCTTP